MATVMSGGDDWIGFPVLREWAKLHANELLEIAGS